MRTPITLKSLDDGRETLDIELELYHQRRTVTLHMLELDADLVCAFLEQLSAEYGVHLGGPQDSLVIALAGRRHPARLQRLGDGRTTTRLGDPAADYLARCQEAIAQLLQALHELDIEAVVADIDRHGRPAPKEGYLHLHARAQGKAQEEAVERVRKEVEAAHGVSVCVLSLSRRDGHADQVMACKPHFAWNPQAGAVVRRHWSSA